MENSKLLAAHLLPLYSSDLDPFSIISKSFFGFFVRDRFGVLNKYSPYRISDQTDEIPTPLATPVPFADLMDQAAIDLIKKANGGNIVVCWSGGIDSTGVLVALLKHLENKSKLKVLCAPSSLEEYPLFYKEFLVKQGISVKITNAIIATLDSLDCEVITSGWCADQLFGSSTHLKLPNAYNLYWVDGVAKLYENYTKGRVKLSSNSLSIIEAVYQEYARTLGVTLEQYCEFAWLFNFGCKFTYVKDMMRLQMPESANRDKHIPFYAGLDFQRWSIGNFANLRISNGYQQPQFLKAPIKQYIAEYTHDTEYLYLKGKVNSYGLVNETYDNGISLLTDEGFKVAKLSNNCNYCMGKLSRNLSTLYRKIS